MTLGGSLFLFAVGAILRYAVSDSIDGIDLAMVGLILMVVAVVGLIVGLFTLGRARGYSDEPPPRY